MADSDEKRDAESEELTTEAVEPFFFSRLLVDQPGTRHCPLCCSLRHVTLASAPQGWWWPPPWRSPSKHAAHL